MLVYSDLPRKCMTKVLSGQSGKLTFYLRIKAHILKINKM